MNGSRVRSFAAILALLLLAVPLRAQRETPEPLTGAQIEKIREAGIDPNERISLYTKFLDEHAQTIKDLTKRAVSTARGRRIDTELQSFTALMDELGSNLDEYSDRKADIRKALKPLNEASQRWLVILRALAGEPAFELSRKEAIESADDLTDQVTRLENEQTTYFNLHKDERGQDRVEPK